MKLFEVVTEIPEEDGKIRTMRQYVTQEDNSLEAVAIYFQRHCEQFEEELKTVSYVADIVQHIKKEEKP